ncbi:MAG TPA: hypothetical protein VN428_27310 [Bryobacteraceae bacterium]|nr:hypothetical protein [Bryobacteraceae bacterium]
MNPRLGESYVDPVPHKRATRPSHVRCGVVMEGAWPVTLFAASLAAFERLTTGEASTLALWTVGVWAACRLVLWAFRWRRALAQVPLQPPPVRTETGAQDARA